MTDETEIKINRKKFESCAADPVKTAKAAELTYVKEDIAQGYSRKRTGKSFAYMNGSKRIKNKKEIDRIKKLVIPPAWENVWICKLPNGHLQATGTDAMGRKQYKYHSSWNYIRNQTKFYRLYEFGKKLPEIRAQIEKNLSLPGESRDKILSAVISLLDMTSIRIGNSFYEKLYGSFGLTTLKNRHVKVNGSNIRFSFTGKKGVKQKISLKSRRLARIIKSCKEIPGKELFEYIDEDGVHRIDSGMVNEFIRNTAGENFTAKDFRTWSGSIHALMAFKSLSDKEPESDKKKIITEMYEMVSKHLGNTKAVCKKYYIHPCIAQLYESDKLKRFLMQLDKRKSGNDLFIYDKVLLSILKNHK